MILQDKDVSNLLGVLLSKDRSWCPIVARISATIFQVSVTPLSSH